MHKITESREKNDGPSYKYLLIFVTMATAGNKVSKNETLNWFLIENSNAVPENSSAL